MRSGVSTDMGGLLLPVALPTCTYTPTGRDIARPHSPADPTTIRGMSANPSSTASDHLTPVHEAAALLGGSPALYTALIEGGLIEGELRDGTWHVDAAVVGAALAMRERTFRRTEKCASNSRFDPKVKTVGGAA